MSYWQVDGQNGLKGVEGHYVTLDDGRVLYQPDPINPAVLSDQTILYGLRQSRVARADFVRVYPSLLPEEKARLSALLENNPAMSSLIVDQQTQADSIQRQAVANLTVQTAGPRGGT